MIILIYHNILRLSIQEYENGVLIEGVVKNAMRIISVLNAYYGDNAYCVRIKEKMYRYGFRKLHFHQIIVRC